MHNGAGTFPTKAPQGEASVALELLLFFLGREAGARMGLLVGVLFAVLVNQRLAGSVLGRVEAFLPVGSIHLVAMVLALMSFIVNVTCALNQ